MIEICTYRPTVPLSPETEPCCRLWQKHVHCWSKNNTFTVGAPQVWTVAKTCPLLEQKQHVHCWSPSGVDCGKNMSTVGAKTTRSLLEPLRCGLWQKHVHCWSKNNTCTVGAPQVWTVAKTCPLLEQKQHVHCWSPSGVDCGKNMSTV